MNIQKQSKETEEAIDRRLNQEATEEKLKTPKHEVENLKTADELLKEIS